MAPSNENLHVYLREIKQGEQTSLSVLAGLVSDGAKVLDLGTGSGALGRHLQARGCTVDGVTINQAEAALAGAAYRRLEIADLDDCDLPALFAGERYDAIICADVLEHLKRPELVVAACRQLLSPQGKLLISVPNAAYCGLIGELLSGEFTYREEGLLDRTHLRFFTRKSLTRFLADVNWVTDAIETVRLNLPASEFRIAFDSLPPAVSRYLLSIPDALTYQLIAVASPQAPGQALVPAVDGPADGQALFSTQLYLKSADGYSEDRKLVTTGVIGQVRQTLNFALEGFTDGLTGLRWDPADRPGFVHLYRIALCNAQGSVLWQWCSEADSLLMLDQAAHHELLLRPPWPTSPAALVLLHGDDPWLELPIPADNFAAGALRPGAVLQVEMGWPMSADYLALSDRVNPLLHRIAEVEQTAAHDMQALAQSAAAERQSIAQAAAAKLDETQRTAAAQHEALERAAAEQRDALELQIKVQREELERQSALQRDQFEREAAAQLERLEAQLSEQARQAEAQRVAAEQQAAQQQAEARQQQAMLENAMAQQQQEKARLAAELLAVADKNQLLQEQNRSLFEQKIVFFREKSSLQAERFQLQRDREGLIQHLEWIENSTVFRATRPLVNFKMQLGRLLSGSKAQTPAAELLAAPQPAVTMDPAPVDVIVPVYKGLADTQCCIESVLRSNCKTPYRLLVINDASPEVEVTAWLRQRAAQEPRMVLLENPENLGFVGTVNRGMSASDQGDVLLLNSDAEVANDWLDRIRAAAYSDARVSTVTPFSNNATICSYPRFCQDNALPEGYDTARLDALFAQANAGQVVDVPTGVGFCMYIRRDSLKQVGLFDTANFGKGYGEENDFCRRASAAGWRNLHLLDTFVRHAGGVSFGASKSPREREAMETLRRLHPDYEPVVHQFVAVDPAQQARRRVHMARVQASGLPVVLAIIHDRQGGTIRHVDELAASMAKQAVFVVLKPVGGGVVSLDFPGLGESLQLVFKLPEAYEELVQCLQDIGVQHIHFHHLLGNSEQVRELPARLGLPYDFTAHDYYTWCPQISLTDHTNGYCGEQGIEQCRNCLSRSPAPGGLTIETWRGHHADFVARARHVLVPSLDAGRRFASYVPTADVRLAPHTDMDASRPLPVPSPQPLLPKAPLRVVVIGALSAIKGADVLEDVALEAARQGVPIEFHLIGYAYRSLRTQPKASLTVHGEYAESELPGLLAWLKPDVLWFPAQWPETYSYTLSAALQQGLPVVAPSLGAFAERLNGRPWSWVKPWSMPSADWLKFFAQIREEHFLTGKGPQVQTFMQPARVDSLVKPWSYAQDYLQDVNPVLDAPLLSADFISAHQPGRDTGALVSRQQVKHGLLMLLLRLRSAKGLRSVARAIPLRWQTRMKTWLRA